MNATSEKKVDEEKMSINIVVDDECARHARKFARLTEEQMSGVLKKHPELHDAFKNAVIPEPETKKKKQKVESGVAELDKTTEAYRIFKRIFDQAASRTSDQMLQNVLQIAESEHPEILEDGTPKEFEKSMQVWSGLSLKDDSSALLSYINLLLQYQKYAMSFIKNYEAKTGMPYSGDVHLELRSAIREATGLNTQVLKSMIPLLRLVKDYPRLLYAGMSRDLLVLYDRAIRREIKEAKEETFWRQSIQEFFENQHLLGALDGMSKQQMDKVIVQLQKVKISDHVMDINDDDMESAGQ